MRHWPHIPALLLLLLLASACGGKHYSADTLQSNKPADQAACPLPNSVQPGMDEDLDAELRPDLSRFGGQGLSQEELRALKNEPGMNVSLKGRELDAFWRYFRYFTSKDEFGQPGKGRQAFTNWLNRAELYLPYVKKYLKGRGLPEDLAYLPFAESGFNPWAVSRSGAVGVWQFMPFTGKKYGLTVDWWLDERRDPQRSAQAAADYLTFLYQTFGDWYLALAAYNAGEGKMARCLSASGCDNFFDLAEREGYLQNETRDYVPKFLAILKIVYNLEALGFPPLRGDCAPDMASLVVKPGTDLKALAKACQLPWNEFTAYNPAYKRSLSPPSQSTIASLPPLLLAKAEEYMANAPTYGGASSRYVVRKGDTWARLASRFDMPEDVLRQINPGTGTHLKSGQNLLIPGAEAATVEDVDTKPATPAAAVADKGQPDKAATKGPAVKAGGTYVVQKGDSLFAIAQQCDVDLDDLLAANKISAKDTIDVGQKLKIPGGETPPAKAAPVRTAEAKQNHQVTHQIKAGDTIWNIAKRYNVSPSLLMAWNNLSKDAVLKPGSTLKLLLE